MRSAPRGTRRPFRLSPCRRMPTTAVTARRGLSLLLAEKANKGGGDARCASRSIPLAFLAGRSRATVECALCALGTSETWNLHGGAMIHTRPEKRSRSCWQSCLRPASPLRAFPRGRRTSWYLKYNHWYRSYTGDTPSPTARPSVIPTNPLPGPTCGSSLSPSWPTWSPWGPPWSPGPLSPWSPGSLSTLPFPPKAPDARRPARPVRDGILLLLKGGGR